MSSWLINARNAVQALKSLPRLIGGGLVVVLLLTLLSGCCIRKTGCCTFRVQCESCICHTGCRPQLMVDYPPCIWDFAPGDCGAPEEHHPETKILPEDLDPLVPNTDYRAQIGDVLEISIFSHDENSLAQLVVAPDGRIYFGFLDGLSVVGRTMDQIAADLETGVSKIYSNPKVVVVPKVKSQDYYMILGKVGKPGIFPLTTAVTLRQAIGDAGGLTVAQYGSSTIAAASLGESFLVRQNRRIDIDFNSLIFDGDDSQNIYMRPGDYIHIASALDQEVYILGAVAARVVPYQDDLTLVGALGGSYGTYIDDAYNYGNWEDVIIVRGSLDCPCVVRVNFKMIVTGCAKDVYIYPGDIIYVPYHNMRFGRTLIKLAINAFVSTFINNIAQQQAINLLQGQPGD